MKHRCFFLLTHFQQPYFCLLQLSIKKETCVLHSVHFSLLCPGFWQDYWQQDFFFSPPQLLILLLPRLREVSIFLFFFFKFCFSQSGFRSDSGVCRLESGFVASTRAAQTQLVTCRLASMSDIWNIHICVAAQCGGIESAKTFDNPGLLSSFLLMQRVGFSSGEPCCSETCYRSSLVRGL